MNKEAEYTVIDQYYQKRGKDMFECIRKNTSIITITTAQRPANLQTPMKKRTRPTLKNGSPTGT